MTRDEFKNLTQVFFTDADKIFENFIPTTGKEIREKEIFKIESSEPGTTKYWSEIESYIDWERADDGELAKQLEEEISTRELAENLLREKAESGVKLNPGIESNKRELVRLYLIFRNWKEKYSISFDDFIDYWYEDIVINPKTEWIEYRACLIGLTCLKQKINYGSYSIDKLSDSEKMKMMNNARCCDFGSPLAMAVGRDSLDNNFWIDFSEEESLSVGTKKIFLLGKARTYQVYGMPESLKNILLVLRLSTGMPVGIRSYYIRYSCTKSGLSFQEWQERFFNYGEFGKNFQLASHKVQTDISDEIVQKISNLLSDYKNKSVKQIDLALEHYFDAFEANLPIYCFTELLMAFESLLNEKPVYKYKLVSRIIDVVLHKNSIHHAIKLVVKILKPQKKKARMINKFFSPDPNGKGCFKIRNDVLHGNEPLDSKLVVALLPDLKEYLRILILQIIQDQVQGHLNANDNSYYSQLEQLYSE